MSSSDQAWQRYIDTLNAVRQRMLAREEAQAHPRVRDQALYALQAVTLAANQMYVLPRQHYPEFYPLWHPPILNAGGPAADFKYHWSFIDGRRTYRIHGRLGTTCFTDLQVFTGYFGDERMRSLGSYDFADFDVAADGTFEVIAGPDLQGRNRVRLDPTETRSIVHVRDVFNDWNARPTQLRIECLDGEPDTMVLTEDELTVRLGKAARMIEQTIARALGYAKRVKQVAGGVNAFGLVAAEGGESKDHGASPRAGYYGLVWDLAPDEALLIEGPVPQARYWSLQLMDLWWGTLDYAHHQSGLNGAQMQIDSDGLFRAVVSYEDPGVPNWLDPLATPIGQAMMRWYDGTTPAIPRVRKVPFAQLRSLLPADTKTVSSDERRAVIRERANAVYARFN